LVQRRFWEEEKRRHDGKSNYDEKQTALFGGKRDHDEHVVKHYELAVSGIDPVLSCGGLQEGRTNLCEKVVYEEGRTMSSTNIHDKIQAVK
jgi:hypothetical protein